MSELIYREDAKDFVRQALSEGYDIIKYLDEVPAVDCPASASVPTVDAVPVCRCKDCKHRPTKPDDYNPITTDGFALEFPDEKCPCQCEDGWYSWYPPDDFFCAKGKRKGGDE